jgi:hypothetical protein
MVAAELTKSGVKRELSGTMAVLGLTVAGIVVGALDPALAGATGPHPTLTGSLADALSILQNNLRVLATPYLLWLLGFPHARLGRTAGDLVTVVLAAASSIPVGIELARWQTRLIPYIPQLPIEWAALATAIAAWLLIRSNAASLQQVACLAGATALLLVVAAAIETWCTPHRVGTRLSEPTVNTTGALDSRVGAGGCLRLGFCAASGHVAARSRTPFPSRSSVPLGHLGGTDRATSTTTDPHEEGIT